MTKTAAKPEDKSVTDKPFHFEVKGDSVDLTKRTFEGLANTWELDLGGDVIERGAFKRTLGHWRNSSKVIPLLDSHDRFSIQSVLGKMVEAKETRDGLLSKFEVVDDPAGDALLKRLQGGYVDGLSIGYRPTKIRVPSDKERNAGVFRFLEEVELREVSAVVFPMNESARVKAEDLESVEPAGDDAETSAPDNHLAEIKDDSEGNGAGLAHDGPERKAMADRVRALKLRRLGLTTAGPARDSDNEVEP